MLCVCGCTHTSNISTKKFSPVGTRTLYQIKSTVVVNIYVLHFLHVVPTPIDILEEIEGILSLGDLSFFQYQLPTSGMTLRLEGDSGRVVMYASSRIRNPNSAFHDYSYDSRVDRGGLYVSPEMLRGGQRGRRQTSVMEMSGNLTNTTLYVTVQGLEETNAFRLLTTFGNTCEFKIKNTHYCIYHDIHNE